MVSPLKTLENTVRERELMRIARIAGYYTRTNSDRAGFNEDVCPWHPMSILSREEMDWIVTQGKARADEITAQDANISRMIRAALNYKGRCEYEAIGTSWRMSDEKSYLHDATVVNTVSQYMAMLKKLGRGGVPLVLPTVLPLRGRHRQ